MFSMKRAKARRHTGPARPGRYLERPAGFAKRNCENFSDSGEAARSTAAAASDPKMIWKRHAGTQSGSEMPRDRILTTHVGSLVRPPKLVEFLHKIEDRPALRPDRLRSLPEGVDRGGGPPAGRRRHRHRQRRRVQQGPQLGLLRPRPSHRRHHPAADRGGGQGSRWRPPAAARTASRSPNSTPNTTGFPAWASGSARASWSTAR